VDLCSEFIARWQEIGNSKLQVPYRSLQRVTLLRILQVVLYPTLVQNTDFLTSVIHIIATGTNKYVFDILLEGYST
jgi:hypothetical protein